MGAAPVSLAFGRRRQEVKKLKNLHRNNDFKASPGHVRSCLKIKTNEQTKKRTTIKKKKKASSLTVGLYGISKTSLHFKCFHVSYLQKILFVLVFLAYYGWLSILLECLTCFSLDYIVTHMGTHPLEDHIYIKLTNSRAFLKLIISLLGQTIIQSSSTTSSILDRSWE